MKTKFFSLFVCLFLLTNVICSQENVQEQKNKKFFLLDFSAGLSDKYNSSLSFKVIIGNEYNQHFSLGVGTGIFYNSFKEENFESYSLDLPIFVNMRGNITKKNNVNDLVPYYSLTIGYIFSLLNANDEYAYVQDWKQIGDYQYNNSYTHTSLRYYEGLFFAPELGLNYKDMYFGVEFLYGSSNQEEHRSYMMPSFVYGDNKDYSIYDTTPSYIISLKFTQKLDL